ncbi:MULTISPECIES: hypothetical protein [Asaia]|uniref:Uncharacterized protein n=1 Tax=Asaia spathodeae TaxID=657016 RepID=A0ABX2P873_9PROT|nr:hypothetical protein [Asaia spathodeae]
MIGTLSEWKASPFYKPAKPQRRLWTLRDEEVVARLYPTPMPSRDIAKQLDRSIGSLRAKARQLGVRRPSRVNASAVARPSPTSSPDLFVNYVSPIERIKSLFQTRGSRLSWSNDGIDMLADLWKRGFAASLIADLIGTTPGAIQERAGRAGLPARYGLTLIETNEKHDPLDYPIHPVIDAQIIPRIDKRTGKRWFVQPKDKRRFHHSRETRMRNARIADNEVDMGSEYSDASGVN